MSGIPTIPAGNPINIPTPILFNHANINPGKNPLLINIIKKDITTDIKTTIATPSINPYTYLLSYFYNLSGSVIISNNTGPSV
jgi:hypothetical protein